ncbi:MBL fold metallo-hydrolase [Terrimonas rubra]|uniref:MBL fold metallo-hydrolase n=1 Tax=Terrimonas rubra TaxID=1035890 RepID=A0ABW5ZYM6_9BACT
MKLTVINAGYFKLDGGAMFGVVPKSIWSKLNPPDENNMCSWALRCLLIEEGDRKILIDTGMGNKQDAKFFGHYYMHGDDSLEKSLQQAGLTTDDITDVFLTHLHFDHCGGAIKKEGDNLVPAFKNAVYWSNELHWQWAVEPNAREKASFLRENIIPIQASEKLKFVATPTDLTTGLGEVIFSENISIRFANGHTSAMMLPQITYKGKTLVYMADLLPSTGHIPLPYVMAYDMYPLTTLDEKKSFLQEAADNNYILFLEHDPVNECCTVHQTDKGIRLKETFKLADI